MNDYIDYGFNEQRPHSATYLEPGVMDLLGPQNRVILDTGCGNGWLTRTMLEAGYDAYGIDASPSGIGVAKQQHPDRFFLQDIRSQSVPEALAEVPFDTIVSTEVIEHLYDPLHFLEFCASILQKNGGGQLIISTPYHGFLKNLAISLADGWDHHFMALHKGEHIKFWSKATLSTALENAGFEVIAFRGAGRFPWLWKSMILQAVLK